MRFKAPAACHAGSEALRLHFQIPVGDILRPPRTKCLATVTGGFWSSSVPLPCMIGRVAGFAHLPENLPSAFEDDSDDHNPN